MTSTVEEIGVHVKMPFTIELSDSEDDDTFVPQNDEVLVLNNAENDGLQVTYEQEVEVLSDPEDEEDSLQSSSLTEDIFRNLLEGGDDFEFDDSDDCTEEEAVTYRRRLRELGYNDFIAETISAQRVTAKRLCTAFSIQLPMFLKGQPDVAYYRLLGKAMRRFMNTRQKLPQFNTIEDAVELLRSAKKIVVITGAGISTNLGIPDFRSKDTGFYEKLRAEGFDQPQDVFDLDIFQEDPSIFYRFCNETFPSGDAFSVTHAFIRLLQDEDKLLTNYTQNIDNIEETVGLRPEKYIQCHGSWSHATCLQCQKNVKIEEVAGPIREGKVPYCTSHTCQPPQLKRKRTSKSGSNKPKSHRQVYDDDTEDGDAYNLPQPGVMKPDITFFGEALPDAFFDRFRSEMGDVDLVIVIGTSMQVAPVSEIPRALPAEVPQIYISRDPCNHINFDITFLGDCDVVCGELAKRVGWNLQHKMLPEDRKTEVTSQDESRGMWKLKVLA